MTARLAQWCGSGLRYREGGTDCRAKRDREDVRDNVEFARGDTDAASLDNGTAFAFAAEPDKRPLETLTVELCHRYAPKTGSTNGAPSHAGFVLTTPTLALEAGTLSYTRRYPHDIGPDLLQFVVGEDMTRLPRLLDYGARYGLWCALREGWRGCPPGALRVAAAYALSRLLWETRFTGDRVRVTSLATCAKRVGMGKDRFGRLVRVLQLAYLQRLRDARAAYARAELTC